MCTNYFNIIILNKYNICNLSQSNYIKCVKDFVNIQKF